MVHIKKKKKPHPKKKKEVVLRIDYLLLPGQKLFLSQVYGVT